MHRAAARRTGQLFNHHGRRKIGILGQGSQLFETVFVAFGNHRLNQICHRFGRNTVSSALLQRALPDPSNGRILLQELPDFLANQLLLAPAVSWFRYLGDHDRNEE